MKGNTTQVSSKRVETVPRPSGAYGVGEAFTEMTAEPGQGRSARQEGLRPPTDGTAGARAGDLRQRGALHKQSIFREERASPRRPEWRERPARGRRREEVGGQRTEDWSASLIAAALLITTPVPEEADQVLVCQQAFSALAPRGGSATRGSRGHCPGKQGAPEGHSGLRDRGSRAAPG